MRSMVAPRMRLAALATGLVLVASASAGQATPEQARAARPMTIVDLLEIPRLSDPQLSPDGTELVFVLSEADWEENERVSHLWRTRLDEPDAQARQLTFGEDGESSPRWSPDGAALAFVAKRGDDEHSQIYLLPARGGEARRVTEHETSVSDVSWDPSGAGLYFVAEDPEDAEEKRRDEQKYDVFAFDENFQQRHLWRTDLQGNAERLTEGDFSVAGYRPSRDGSRLVLHRTPTPLFDNWDEGEVWVTDPKGENGVQLTDNTVSESGATLSPDGRWVLYTSGSSPDLETYFNDNLFLVPSNGGPHRVLLESMPYEVGSAEWSADGSAIFFTANTGVRSELFRVDLATETFVQLTEGDHAVRQWRYLPELDRHVMTIDEPENPGDVWQLAGPDGALAQVTHLFDHLGEEFQLPRQEAVRWNGEDGTEVEGLLYYPLDYREGTRYPLAVQTHGGPAASDKFGFGRWGSYVQVLAARGWMVFKPNYRGSTGYGDDFLRDMVGHYYRQSHLDVMTGVDALIERGLVDGDRMVKMGWSGGGHMTNKIITFTTRFKAASSGAGAVNWISMYGQSDVRTYRTPWFGGTPWEQDAPIATYWEHSPLKDIWKVETPTIVLVGENDVRVPPPQSVELYRALRSNGVDSHLYMAPREPHGWRELRHELFKVNIELEWFERHALGREYEWEWAPGDDEEESAESDERPPGETAAAP